MLKVKIHYTDGREVEANVGPRARVEVERKFDAAFWELIGESATRPREDVAYFMAFSAARFAGLDAGAEGYDEWLATIDDVDVWSAADVDPTRREATPAASSPSASPPESHFES